MNILPLSLLPFTPISLSSSFPSLPSFSIFVFLLLLSLSSTNVDYAKTMIYLSLSKL